MAAACYAAGALVGTASLREHRPAAGSPRWEYPAVQLADDLAPEHRARLEKVREVVCRVMEAHPASARAVASLAVLHYLSYDIENEARCWERCLELDPAFSPAHARLVALAEQQGDYERVVGLLGRAMALPSAGGHAANRRRLASALRELRRYEEARRVLEDLVRDGPGSAEVHFLLGDVYSRLGDLERARDSLEIALALEPDRVEALYRLSMVCARLGEAGRAAAYRARFDALKSDELAGESAMGARHEMEDEGFVATRLAEVLKYASAACLEGNDQALAEETLRMAVAFRPGDAELRRHLAELYLRTGGDLAEARQHAERAVELEPAPRAFLILAAIAERSGDLAGARTALERAMALDPGNPDYQGLYDALSRPQ